MVSEGFLIGVLCYKSVVRKIQKDQEGCRKIGPTTFLMIDPCVV